MVTSLDMSVTEVMTGSWCNVTYVVSQYQDVTMQQECEPPPPRDQGLGTPGPQWIIKLAEHLNIWEIFTLDSNKNLVSVEPTHKFVSHS